MNRPSKLCSLSAVLLATSLYLPGPASSQDEPMVTPILRLNLDVALQVAQAAIDKCRGMGLNIAVTVVDRGGNVQVVLRDTLAMDLTVLVSERKAFTAMSFNLPTSALTDRFTSPFSVAKVEQLILSGGGVPIAAGGTIIGGVGVSGAPSGEQDETCARAGVDAIIDDLEMSL